ncbi:hypothetical protein [Streptomyces sp. EN23]|uniref:hypothetical protein n=1 Tax=Streptomyces sp. EN23 TaxID=212774 RepID=UPI000B1B963E|nr:hypothetical protein [Streptomyces sp. EN23]
MHDPTINSDDLSFDFGLTGLGGSFHGDWVLFAADQWDHITQWCGPPDAQGGGRRLLLADDVRRLVESPLTGAELNALWRLTDSNALDGSPEIGGRERDWPRRASALAGGTAEPHRGGAGAAPCARGTGGPETDEDVSSPTYAHRLLTDDVKQLIDRLDPCRDAVEAFGSSVPRELYGRLERVGERFGYGPRSRRVGPSTRPVAAPPPQGRGHRSETLSRQAPDQAFQPVVAHRV